MSSANRGAKRQDADFYGTTCPSDTRPIPGYDGYYAGADGRVYSAKRPGSLRPLATGRDKDDYPSVQLAKPGAPGKSNVRAVHRLIALAWYGPKPSSEYEVRHLNGDRVDSRPSNLVYGTRKENAEDRDRHGRTARGQHVGTAKLTETQVLSVRAAISVGETYQSIAKRLGVCIATVGHIKSGRNWRMV